MHTTGLFALDLLTKDPEGRWMPLKLWWLKPSSPTENFIFATAFQLPQTFDPQDLGLELHNVRSNAPLRSGDVLTLRAHNPLAHTLPDTRLLELQGFLNRVIAIREAADPEELDDNEDTDDADDGVGGDYFPKPIIVYSNAT